MNRIIQILIKNHVFLLFIILELISLQLLIANQFVAENNFLKQISNIKSTIFLKETELKSYFNLKTINTELLKEHDSLFKENLYLKKQLTITNNEVVKLPKDDSMFVIQTNVLRNSWNKKQNFITIENGTLNGLKSKMGVVNNDGLVGITHNVSENFSTIISLINTDLTISAKIKNSGKFGTLNWDGKDPQIMQLTGLTKNTNIKIGDTIVTSAYSNILPKDINIGLVSSYQVENNTNFLTINVDLFVDFTNIHLVYILHSPSKEERELIEKNY